MLLLKLFFLYVTWFLIEVKSVLGLEFKYHNREELEQLLYEFSENITEPLQGRVYSIGKSTEGRDILVFEITAAQANADIVPNIQFTGNIHGNEPPGREVLLHYIAYLIENYDSDDRVRWLLDNTRIHILPSLNPDGWEIAQPGDCQGVVGRHNAKNIDLNRNFPDFIPGSKKQPEQPEVTAVRNWMKNNSFVLAGDLHAGAIVTIYPFHRLIKSKYGYELRTSVTPDNNIFIHLANVYAKNNEIMHLQSTFCDNETFPGGITRGANWYFFLGGMQDYSYLVHGTLALTFEISCCKFPSPTDLAVVWEQNKNSLLLFSLEANMGVTAFIFDSQTTEGIPNANVTILGIEKVFNTNADGRFWKILVPGKYYIRIEAENYKTVEYIFMVENSQPFHKLTKLEIEMFRT